MRYILSFIFIVLTGGIMVLVLGPGLWVSILDIPPDGYFYIFYDVFSMLCHQIINRSFVIDDFPMLVCHRCFGIYMGLFVMMFIGIWFQKWERISGMVLPLLVIMIIVNIVDVLGNHWLWVNSMPSRILFGFLLGNTVSLILMDVIWGKWEANHQAEEKDFA